MNEILEAENKVPFCDNSESEIHRPNLTVAAFKKDKEDIDVQDEVTQSEKKYRHLQMECITRWNSTLEMLKSLLSLKDEANESLKRTEHYDICITTSEWILIAQLCTVLEAFSTLCDLASSGLAISYLIPLIRATVKDSWKANEKDCDKIISVKKNYGQFRQTISN